MSEQTDETKPVVPLLLLAVRTGSLLCHDRPLSWAFVVVYTLIAAGECKRKQYFTLEQFVNNDNTTNDHNKMETYHQSTQQTNSTDYSPPPDNTMRRHNTLKDRIKRSMNKAGEATARRRSSVLAAASALASLAGGDHKIVDAYVNTEMVDTSGHPTSTANELHEERWITFPEKLMSVLDNDQLSAIITWLPHGKGFIILQKKKFASDIMPLYFKHSKFTSFTRKLNRWGFTRVPRGPETGAYYHKVSVSK